MLNRNFRLKFDLSDYDDYDVPDIRFCLMDTDSSVLYVQLLNENENINLSNMSLIMYISKPDGTEVLLNGIDEDFSNGLVKFLLPKQALIFASNNYNAEVRVIDNGRCIVSRPFKYSVIENLSSSDQQMLSSNEYVLLVDSLKRLSDIEKNELERIENEKVRIQQEVKRQESIGSMKNNVDNKIVEINNARDEVMIKIAEINSTLENFINIFNSLAPEESTNAEVQLARTDISGVLHDSLKDRLDKIEKEPSIMWETVEG
jgi:hypothetical protein